MRTAFQPSARTRRAHAEQASARPGHTLRNTAFGAWAAAAGLACAALAAGPALAAGQVELRYTQPEQFTDIGLGHYDRSHNLRILGEHFMRLGQALPDGQVLELEVTDVDLAGRIEPHQPHELRVLRGSADWPHISLRYTLKAGDTILAQGEEQLSDPSYMFPRRRALEHQPLPYERRMLEAWFKERFSAQTTAAVP
jgi:hypothetical protein